MPTRKRGKISWKNMDSSEKLGAKPSNLCRKTTRLTRRVKAATDLTRRRVKCHFRNAHNLPDSTHDSLFLCIVDRAFYVSQRERGAESKQSGMLSTIGNPLANSPKATTKTMNVYIKMSKFLFSSIDLFRPSNARFCLTTYRKGTRRINDLESETSL